MFDRSDVIYVYDGSFDGFLCCVFESYARKEVPVTIQTSSSEQLTLFHAYEIITNIEKASRVKKSIPLKMGYESLEFLYYAFLTCLVEKELHMLKFMYLGYKYGQKAISMLTDNTVHILQKAVKHLTGEAHLYKGFVRFSVYEGLMFATIEPKNYVLPILGAHFKDRFPAEKFLLYDKNHQMVCTYADNQLRLAEVAEIKLPDVDEQELFYRNLWRMFYDTIGIKQRENHKCRMTHMPKRYWACMTEFQTEKENVFKIKQHEKSLLLK